MAERNAAAGYAALKKETTKGTAVTPNVYTPYYKQDLVTDFNLMSDTPVYGDKFRRYQTLQGLRSHGGSLQVMAEPNTAGYWFDMLCTKTATSGSNPYTHTFKPSITTDPNSYTLDISLASQVVRFMGVEASKITLGFDGDKMVFDIDVAGLKSFYGREIASVSGTTVVLKTDYDPSPTDGLVASDLIKLTTINGLTSTNFTVSSITNATTFEASATAAAFAAGDMVLLRPATPSLSLLTPFLWPRTQFFFAADAATAQTNSATASNQTRLEPGSQIAIMHDFETNEGAKRSGAFDPASLPRTQYDLEIKIKKYFDLPDEFKYWNALTKRALVMRSYSGTDKELRVTINNMKALTDENPTESGGTIFHEIEYVPNYDSTDTQGFDAKVINAISSI